MPKMSNPARVAREVIKQAENKKLINFKDAMLNVGYSLNSANVKGKQVRNSLEYQREVSNFSNEIQDRIKEANQIMIEKRHKASYRDGLEAVDKLKRLETFLSGDKPQVSISVNWE